MFDLKRWYGSSTISPVLTAAEIGINHGGDFDLARRLIDAAAEAGANAVKFQVFRTEDFYHAGLAKGAYDLFRSFELSFDQFARLKEHSETHGLLFFGTPLDLGSLRFLGDLGPGLLKVASSDITSEPFLEEIARVSHAKAMFPVLSTGFVRMPEIRKAMRLFKDTNVSLLYCVSRYPARAEDGDFDLKFIDRLAEQFRVPVGFSDHSLDIFLSLGAVARGARMVERHFTLDRGIPGADHAMSLTPGQFREMVRGIRELESAIGDGSKRVTAFENEIAPHAMRSIYTARPIQKGQRITEKDLVLLRPGNGVSLGQWHRLIGKKSDRDIGVYEKI